MLEVWVMWKRGKKPCEMAWKTMLNTAEMSACSALHRCDHEAAPHGWETRTGDFCNQPLLYFHGGQPSIMTGLQ